MPNVLGTQYMLAQGAGTNFELLRKQCWAITIGGLDITLLAQSVNIPRVEVEAIEAYHFNEKVKAAGKPAPGDITVDILDAIAPDVFTQLDEWFNSVYDSRTGSMGYASEYKRQMIITQMDQKGNTIRTWTASGVWPKNAPAPNDQLDYTSHDFVKLHMVFACDRVTPNGSTGTGGNITT